MSWRAGRAKTGDLPDFLRNLDPSLKLDTKPSDRFPAIEIPIPSSLSRHERIQISRLRSFRDRVHEGPLYTILGDGYRAGKQRRSGPAEFDPFDGMPSYSIKYRKAKRRVPKLDTRPYILGFFPKELWSTIDPGHSVHNGTGISSNKKLLDVTSLKGTNENIHEFNMKSAGESEDISKRRLEDIPNDEEDEKGDDEGDEEIAAEDEEVDDDFAEDESDMGEDYNAENYFDGGGDDDGDNDVYDDGEGWY